MKSKKKEWKGKAAEFQEKIKTTKKRGFGVEVQEEEVEVQEEGVEGEVQKYKKLKSKLKSKKKGLKGNAEFQWFL